MKKAIVLGTNHSIQRGEKLKNEFYSFLTDLCTKEKIKCIAEEIDDSEMIVAKDVCDKLNIIHLVIEPNLNEYENLGIRQYHQVQYEVMNLFELNAVPSEDNNTPKKALKEFNSLLAEQHIQPREKEWFKRIAEKDVWPVLIIFGANHFETFNRLLSEKGIEVTQNASNWGSECLV